MSIGLDLRAMLAIHELRERASKLGIDALGVTSADPFPEHARGVGARLDDGLMPPDLLEAEEILREAESHSDPAALLPGARSVISFSVGYIEAALPTEEVPLGLRGRTARYLWRDHEGDLREKWRQMVQWLERKGARCSEETHLPHRAAAARAGIGSVGKNSNIQSMDHGSWCLLATIVTDAELDCNEPMAPRCGSCRRCIGACPTKAIVEPYVVDASRCVSHLLASGLPIPPELRGMIGDKVSGCDVCQEVCPRNWYVVPKAWDRPDLDARRPDLLRLLNTGKGGPMKNTPPYLGHWRPDRALLRRNAAVALGNSGVTTAVPHLIPYLEDRDPRVRSHSAWSLGKLGGDEAVAALRESLRQESDPRVLAEVEQALSLIQG